MFAAATTATLMFAAVAVGQIGLACGAPWGKAAYGGASAHLPTRLRITSGVSAVILVLVVLIVLRRAGTPVWAPLPDGLLPIGGWVISGLLVVSAFMNLISRSPLERAIAGPVSAVALVSTVAVNLLASPQV